MMFSDGLWHLGRWYEGRGTASTKTKRQTCPGRQSVSRLHQGISMGVVQSPSKDPSVLDEELCVSFVFNLSALCLH